MSVCQSSGHRLREHCRARGGMQDTSCGLCGAVPGCGIASCPVSSLWLQQRWRRFNPTGVTSSGKKTLFRPNAASTAVYILVDHFHRKWFFFFLIVFYFLFSAVHSDDACLLCCLLPWGIKTFESGWKAWVFLLIPLNNGIAHQNLIFKKKNFSESERVCMRYRTC